MCTAVQRAKCDLIVVKPAEPITVLRGNNSSATEEVDLMLLSGDLMTVNAVNHKPSVGAI